VTYAWQSSAEIAALMGHLEQVDREDFFRLRERLEDDPRSEAAGAMPYMFAAYPEVWSAPFGDGYQLVYRIVNECELEPLAIWRPPPPPA
jgi:hypothetical protein